MVAGLFEKAYNNEDFDAVFALFSAEMKSALPNEKTKEFLGSLMQQAGKIQSRTFTNYVNTTFASYKTQFERALLAVNISVDGDSKINGLFVKPFVDNATPVLQRNFTPLQLPFKEEWTVVWGGDTRELNYHVDHAAQKNAFDLVITDKYGRSFKGSGERNEDYYAFG